MLVVYTPMPEAGGAKLPRLISIRRGEIAAPRQHEPDGGSNERAEDGPDPRASAHDDERGGRASISRRPPDQPGRPDDGPEGADRRRVPQVPPRARILSASGRAAPAGPDDGDADGRAGAGAAQDRRLPDPGAGRRDRRSPLRSRGLVGASAPGDRLPPRRRVGAVRSRDASRALRPARP